MVTVPDDLRERLRRYGQEHVLMGWDKLGDAERQGLVRQLSEIDFDQLRRLYDSRDRASTLPSRDRIAPIPVSRLDTAEVPRWRALGEAALKGGEVAALVVAGGQGSRLGFEQPKGMFAIGPVTQRSLFQIHAEKVLALRHRYGAAVPLLVMTSPATHDEALGFFRAQKHF